MSGDSNPVDIDKIEEVSIREIFNCIGQVEALISGHSRLLWKLPRDFYKFLIKDVVPNLTLEIHPLFQNGTAQTLALHQLMMKGFEEIFPHDSQPTTSEELITNVSWKEYGEQNSALELFSMCFPLDSVIESLELLKEMRMKQVQETMNQELKRKQSTGLTDFVAKSKMSKATEDSRDPSSSYTSTSSRALHTCK